MNRQIEASLTDGQAEAMLAQYIARAEEEFSGDELAVKIMELKSMPIVGADGINNKKPASLKRDYHKILYPERFGQRQQGERRGVFVDEDNFAKVQKRFPDAAIGDRLILENETLVLKKQQPRSMREKILAMLDES